MKPMHLRYLLLLPLAVRWAKARERHILKEGQPLGARAQADARAAGVAHPERIRILLVDMIEGPTNRFLRRAADESGLFSPAVQGIAYGYGLMIRRDCYPDRLLVAHECVHTAQYERFGGFAGYLFRYLRECLVIGYPDGPLEQEALRRAVEIVGG